MRNMVRRTLFLCGAVCAGLLTVSPSTFAQVKTDKNTAVFRITESLYQESRAPVGRNADNPDSEPQITMKGKVKIEFTLPLDGILPANFDSRCGILVVIGNFKYIISRDDDPKWKVGNPGFTVALAERDTGGGIRIDGSGNVLPAGETKPKVFGKARVKWNFERITVLIEGEVPGLRSPAAILYADEEPGKLDIDTTAAITLYFDNTEYKRDFDVKLTGDLKRTKRMNEPIAIVTTVELKGDGKPKD